MKAAAQLAEPSKDTPLGLRVELPRRDQPAARPLERQQPARCQRTSDGLLGGAEQAGGFGAAHRRLLVECCALSKLLAQVGKDAGVDLAAVRGRPLQRPSSVCPLPQSVAASTTLSSPAGASCSSSASALLRLPQPPSSRLAGGDWHHSPAYGARCWALVAAGREDLFAAVVISAPLFFKNSGHASSRKHRNAGPAGLFNYAGVGFALAYLPSARPL